MESVKGGKCALTYVTRGKTGSTRWNEHAPHVSTGRDIDASRFAPVHICDVCGCLFVPRATPTEVE